MRRARARVRARPGGGRAGSCAARRRHRGRGPGRRRRFVADPLRQQRDPPERRRAQPHGQPAPRRGAAHRGHLDGPGRSGGPAHARPSGGRDRAELRGARRLGGPAGVRQRARARSRGTAIPDGRPGTADATPEFRAEGVRAVIAAADAAGVTAYGSFSNDAEAVAVANSAGIRAAEGRTSAQLLTVHMSPDGGTGYAEAVSMDATTIDAAAIGREAATKARASDRAVDRARGRLPGRPRGVRGRRHHRPARLRGLQRAVRPGRPLVRRAWPTDRVGPRDDRRRRRRTGCGPADGVRLRGRPEAARHAARGRRLSRRGVRLADRGTRRARLDGARPAGPEPVGPVPAERRDVGRHDVARGARRRASTGASS